MITLRGIISQAVISIFGIIVVTALPANATMISLNQSASKINGHSMLNVDVVASELFGRGVGAFDVTVEYNYPALYFVRYSLSSELGNKDYPVIDCSYNPKFTPGLVNLSGVSLLQPEELLSIQGNDDKVTLGSIRFRERKPGTGEVKIITTPIVFTDPCDHNEIILTNYIGDVFGNQSSPSVKVPEPSSVMFIVSGIALLIGCVLRKEKPLA
jgi:hypothetical protein